MAETFSGGQSSAQPSAPKGKRIAADFIDLFLVPILLGLVMGLILFRAPEGVRSMFLVLMNVVWLVVRDAVYSPGRTMVGLKLISLTGSKVTLGQAAIRNVLLVIPFVLVVGYIIEIVSVLAKGERISDKWAKTQVISVS